MQISLRNLSEDAKLCAQSFVKKSKWSRGAVYDKINFTLRKTSQRSQVDGFDTNIIEVDRTLFKPDSEGSGDLAFGSHWPRFGACVEFKIFNIWSSTEDSANSGSVCSTTIIIFIIGLQIRRF